MPLVHEEKNSFDTRIQVWHIDEDLAHFTDRLVLTEKEAIDLYAMHPRRALEWAASRYMLHTQTELTVPFSCLYDAHGRPYIPGSPDNVSISHSYGMVAIALSKRDIGIDIQIQNNKVSRIRHKFVTPEEDAVIANGDTLAKLHLCWSSKEALYKAWARRQLEFREHITVDLPGTVATQGQITGAVKKGAVEMHCALFYRFIDKHILVYAIQQ